MAKMMNATVAREQSDANRYKIMVSNISSLIQEAVNNGSYSTNYHAEAPSDVFNYFEKLGYNVVVTHEGDVNGNRIDGGTTISW